MTDIPDGSLTTELRYRDLLIREIRAFKPDLVLTHRPNDYHPDHRNTGTLVMDSSYLVMVPYVVPDSPALKKMPYIFHFFDRFLFPGPFAPDTVVSVDDVIDRKTAMLNCHASQFYEWLPWVGGYSAEVPPEQNPGARLEWLKTFLNKRRPEISGKYREILERRYGKKASEKISGFEAFGLCEYGAQTDSDKLDKLFPL
jgi:LmbE family N-acetylglucosaminyl deacetylase